MRNIFKVALFKRIIDKIFQIGVLVKAIFGFFEIMGGILFAISEKIIVNNLIIYLAQQEIADDPNDIIANFLINAANNLSEGSRVFAVAYLIFHGAVNIVLAMSLIKGFLRAYFASIVFFGIFIIYQIYRYFHTYSLSLLLLTLFDILFVIIIYLEYRKQKSRRLSAKAL